MGSLFLCVLLICIFVSCDNFNPDTDSYMQPCEISIDMSAMYDDIQSGCIEVSDYEHIRISSFFYDAKSGELLYDEDTFLKTLPRDYKMSVRKLDLSRDKYAVIFADIVQVNEYGDVFGDMYISKTDAIDSVRVIKGSGISDTGRAYFSKMEMPAMQQTATCMLTDCCRRVRLNLNMLNAYNLNHLEFDIEYDNYFYFSETSSSGIITTEKFNYISSSDMEFVFTFISKSIAIIRVNDILSIDLSEYPMDAIIDLDCDTWEYNITECHEL